MQVESARRRIQALIQPEGAKEEHEAVVSPDAVPPLPPPPLPLSLPPDDMSANSGSALGDSQGVSGVLGAEASAGGGGGAGGESEVGEA